MSGVSWSARARAAHLPEVAAGCRCSRPERRARLTAPPLDLRMPISSLSELLGPVQPDGEFQGQMALRRYCPEPGCGQPVDAEVAVCPYCGFNLEPHSPSAAPSLLVVLPDGSRWTPPPGGRLLLGRDSECPVADALAPYPNVSRQHAQVVEQGGAVLVWDMDSTNGTWVDGQRVGVDTENPTCLRPGQTIRLGAHCVIHVEGSNRGAREIG